jgi:hypothetical protein
VEELAGVRGCVEGLVRGWMGGWMDRGERARCYVYCQLVSWKEAQEQDAGGIMWHLVEKYVKEGCLSVKVYVEAERVLKALPLKQRWHQ